jgi:hypothetical protein
MEKATNTINSAQTTEQKPPTKVFIPQVGHTRFYDIYVEAESEEQAKQAWEKTRFEYSAKHQPDYEWEENEFIIDVYDSDCTVEHAEVDYDEVREALGLESLKVKEE